MYYLASVTPIGLGRCGLRVEKMPTRRLSMGGVILAGKVCAAWPADGLRPPYIHACQSQVISTIKHERHRMRADVKPCVVMVVVLPLIPGERPGVPADVGVEVEHKGQPHVAEAVQVVQRHRADARLQDQARGRQAGGHTCTAGSEGRHSLPPSLPVKAASGLGAMTALSHLARAEGASNPCRGVPTQPLKQELNEAAQAETGA